MQQPTHQVSTNSHMNIMHIISGDLWGGAEAQVHHTLLNLKKQRDIFVVCVLLNNGILEKNLRKRDIRVIVLDENKFNNFSLLLKLRQAVNYIKPDIIHSHGVKEHFLGAISSLMLTKKIPLIRTVHGLSNVPNGLSRRQYYRTRLVILLDRFFIANMADTLIAVSKDLEQNILARRVKGGCHHIYNAVDICESNINSDNSAIRERYGAKNLFWVGTAVRLVESKNLGMLIDAANYLVQKKIPFRVSIFGDGPMRQELQEHIRKCNLSANVLLHGFSQNILSIIKSLDVFVLCSLHEGLPMSLLEAMFLKTPVVSTAVGGAKEVIKNDVNGLLVGSRDSSALAECLIALYKNPDKAFTLAQNAKETIEREFLMSNRVKQLIKVYSEVFLSRA